MDEKRHSDEVESLKKRIKLDELSEDGPLTQEDVTYFKKEAIWRQMQMYKSKVNKFSREMVRYQNELKLSELKVATLDTWYQQLINLLNSLVPDKESKNHEEMQKLSQNYLLKIDDDNLLERRKQLNDIIHKIFNTISSDSSNIANLQDLSLEIANLTLNNKQLEKSKHDLLNQVEELEKEIQTFANKQLRAQSVTLKRANSTVIKQETPEVGISENEDSKESVKQEENHQTNQTNTPTQEQIEINKDEIEKLNIELQELRSTTKLLTDQLAESQEMNSKLEQTRLDLQNKLDNLGESDVMNSIYYKNLQDNVDTLQQQNDKLVQINELNNSKLIKLETDLNDITKLVTQESQDEINLLKNQLSKSETDLVRIRTIRDDLISKNTILKAEFDSIKPNEEFIKLVKTLQERIDYLEQDKSQKFEKEVSDEKLEKLSQEQLIKRIIDLNEELKQIEIAFKETRELSLKKMTNTIEQQNLVKKLQIEKTKADQKYFASMRLKDSILLENKLLKVQISKSQEMVKNLSDLEKTYQNKIDNLIKSINDYKLIKQNSMNEVTKLQQQNKLLNNWKLEKQQELKKQQNIITENSQKISNLEQGLKNKDLEINKFDIKLKATEDLLKKYKANNTSSILAEDEQQIEALRSIAKCSVCSKNWKDTVITVCGHVFCNHCTQERLAARLRRCPSCNKGFSGNDLLSIHL